MFNARRLAAAAAAVMTAAALMIDARAQDSQDTLTYSQALADLNVALRSAGVTTMRIDRAEISVSAEGWQGATTLVANDREHQVESLFVERDPRRGGFADISYLVDQSDGSALAFVNPTGNVVTTLPNAVTEPILDRATMRWQNSTRCAGPDVTKIADDGSDPDLVDGLINVAPAEIGTPRADITHAGWLPGSFFNRVATNGSQFILGATFTLIFLDADGNPTDIDNNGRTDTALREIYYNRGFGWSEGPARPRGVDIDSVATHEAGHAFGLGHFGKVFVDDNNRLKYAPRAIMNAVYLSPFTTMTGTDNASYCSIWASRQ
jgi:hypothetical protein